MKDSQEAPQGRPERQETKSAGRPDRRLYMRVRKLEGKYAKLSRLGERVAQLEHLMEVLQGEAAAEALVQDLAAARVEEAMDAAGKAAAKSLWDSVETDAGEEA